MNLSEIFAKLGEFLGKLTGQSDRIEVAATKLEALAQEGAVKDARILELEGLLSAAPSAEALAELQGKFDLEKARADKAELDLKTEKESFTTKLNAELANAISANGYEPVSTVTTKPEKSEGKVDQSLKGFAKVSAAFKAQSQKA